MADIFNRCAKLGPGGWKCPCCGPKKTGKDRAKTRRLQRRRLKAQDAKEFKDAA